MRYIYIPHPFYPLPANPPYIRYLYNSSEIENDHPS